jgi:hypothetical protein
MPRWRTIAAWAVRALGVALGAAIALIYVALIWTSPPSIDWPRARLRAVMGLYVLTPAALFGGPAWIFFWVAARIAPLGYNEKNDRETDL